MKITIGHEEKTKGLIFSKTLHGVSLSVTFSEEEKAIIDKRNLTRVILLERDAPADVDADKHANRGLAKKLATAAVGGLDANHFDLTFGKLLNGTDLFWFHTPIEAKQYEDHLKTDTLPRTKEYIVGNAATGTGDTFEL